MNVSLSPAGLLSTSSPATMMSTHPQFTSQLAAKILLQSEVSPLVTPYRSLCTQLHSSNGTAHTSPLDSTNIMLVCQMTCWNPAIQCLCQFPKKMK